MKKNKIYYNTEYRKKIKALSKFNIFIKDRIDKKDEIYEAPLILKKDLLCPIIYLNFYNFIKIIKKIYNKIIYRINYNIKFIIEFFFFFFFFKKKKIKINIFYKNKLILIYFFFGISYFFLLINWLWINE